MHGDGAAIAVSRSSVEGVVVFLAFAIGSQALQSYKKPVRVFKHILAVR